MNPKEGGQGRGVTPNKGDVVRERIAGFVRGLRGIRSGVQEHPVQAGTVAALAVGGALGLAKPSEAIAAIPDGQKNAISQPDTTQRVTPIGLKVGVFEGFPTGIQQKVAAQEELVIHDEPQVEEPSVQEEALGEPPPEAPEEVLYEDQQTGGVENENGIDQPVGLEPRPLQGGGRDPLGLVDSGGSDAVIVNPSQTGETEATIEGMSLGFEYGWTPMLQPPLEIIAGGKERFSHPEAPFVGFKFLNEVQVLMPAKNALVPERYIDTFNLLVSRLRPGETVIPTSEGLITLENKARFVRLITNEEEKIVGPRLPGIQKYRWHESLGLVRMSGLFANSRYDGEKWQALPEPILLGTSKQHAVAILNEFVNYRETAKDGRIVGVGIDPREVEEFRRTGDDAGFKTFQMLRDAEGTPLIPMVTGGESGITINAAQLKEAIRILNGIDPTIVRKMWAEWGVYIIVGDFPPRAFDPQIAFAATYRNELNLIAYYDAHKPYPKQTIDIIKVILAEARGLKAANEGASQRMQGVTKGEFLQAWAQKHESQIRLLEKSKTFPPNAVETFVGSGLALIEHYETHYP